MTFGISFRLNGDRTPLARPRQKDIPIPARPRAHTPLGEAVSPTVLGYLVLNYWGHYSGWPDLLVYRANQWFLAEVKSWSDKLNDNQKRWIEDNHRYLHLPFKLVQVHRMESMSAPAA